MKTILWISFCVLMVMDTKAQSTRSITGTADTSYSLYSALSKTLKTHPQARIAPEPDNGLFDVKNNIAYCAIGERKLLLDAFIPKLKSNKKSTAIIIVHGGGWRSGNRAMLYPMAKQLAAIGYVCFTPAYRLSTEALFPAAVHDLKAAVCWVRTHTKQFNIDEKKIVVAGHSAGGELASFLGTTNGKAEFNHPNCSGNESSQVNAVINIDGILAFIHPESGEGDDSKRTSAATYWFGFSKAENPGLWENGSPLTHAGAHTPPILFINSSVDRMHAGRDDFIKVLKQYHIYSEVKSFETAPHSFCLFDPWLKPTVLYIDDFLKTVFKK